MALTSKLTAIGDAIREKTGKNDLLTLDQMPVEIRSIQGGGGGGDIPPEAFILTNDCSYMFYGNNWNWFIEQYGHLITTTDVMGAESMFQHSMLLTDIPFDINIGTNCHIFKCMFDGCYALKAVPRIRGAIATTADIYKADLTYMFQDCYILKSIPDDYFWTIGGEDYWAWNESKKSNYSAIFVNCHALRKLPDISMLASASSYTNCLYYRMVYNCYCLEEVVNLPVITKATYTSNCFTNTFNYCTRLTRLVFKTNEDGTPIKATWSKATIDLSQYIGYATAAHKSYINKDGGIPADKEVKDEATYQALKNDPDWYSSNVSYSRYNHASAVETINSLPDVTGGSNNTIKFGKNAGKHTDGGAISNLTEAEIAVAAAKGWTVTLS